MDTVDMWEAEAGLETLRDFGKPRQLILRAMRESLDKFAKKHLNEVQSLLEIGSGAGFLESAWPNYDWSWTQLEPQIAFIEEAKKHNPNGVYVNSSAYDLPFSNNSFDAVCGFGSFDCFSDLESTVDEATRVLKPSGTFFHMLDLGANYKIIFEEFKKKRIPARIMGKTDKPFFLPMGNVGLRYIPEEKIDDFLSSVGMTRKEMDAMPEIDDNFAYDAFARKKGINPNLNSGTNDDEKFNNFEIVSDLLFEYSDLFEKYSIGVDANAYFSQKLVKIFNGQDDIDCVKKFQLVGKYRGKRKQHHKDISEIAFCFNRDVGEVDAFKCFLLEIPLQGLYSVLKERLPKIANYVEPSCYERSVIDCVVAIKKC
jgi:ubiquinone/menaquinone biosynthesis C-methylase UbiE